ncbi:hypothetical protein AAC387_Pa01g0730 [Persea americana]
MLRQRGRRYAAEDLSAAAFGDIGGEVRDPPQAVAAAPPASPGGIPVPDVEAGYEGNPYLEGGCKDIDECITGNYTCRAGKCKNKEGGYDCTPNIQLLVVILGVGLSLLFVLIAGSFIYWGLKKRKIILLKDKFFRQNGGLLLQQQITSHGVAVTTKIFSTEELERATNKFAEDRIIGRGGYGTVYKGILPDNTTVAIKKSKIVDETQIEQFINEDRLRIASETAGALDYLHSAASIPIFHRDVKSTNILLDHNLTAKVSDFGASRLVPLDQTQLNTLVQGTLGYLDPEYFQTGQLTEKSDVYSFGVVLVEMLTGEKPICLNRSQEERNLSMYFILSMKENRLFGVLENRVVDEGGVEQLLAVARLAKRCLKVKGEERPTMKEVAMELEGLRSPRIASETAGALDYLHSAASIPIFHRDVESTNILLDHILTAKVADFGTSRLVPLDQTQLNTLVQGTLGYLDPEYFQTGQLTEKSDVYSFGVVLVEMLTGEKPICLNRSQEERNLSMYFICQ